MREIKFRAFSKTNGMEYIEDLYWFEEHGVLDYKGQGHYDKYEIMQYIGLKDINGVEIYEGDICSYADFDDEMIVKFHEGTFTMGHFDFLTQMIVNNNKIIVIGNIHEDF